MQIYRLFPICQFKEMFLGKFYDGVGKMMENLGKKNYICSCINLVIPIAIGSKEQSFFNCLQLQLEIVRKVRKRL